MKIEEVESESKVDKSVDKRDEEEPSRKKDALDRMKGLNFVRAPHHIAPMGESNVKGIEKKLSSLKMDSDSDKPDPFAKKKVLGGK